MICDASHRFVSSPPPLCVRIVCFDSYTCIGLSLVETFFHDELHQRPLVVPAAGGSGADDDREKGGQSDGDEKNAARLAPLRAAWNGGGAGSVCAQRYASDASRRNSFQPVPASSSTVQEQR